MEVRSYYATTVEAAMMLAKKELGTDALLVESTLSTPELAHLGKYQVVFAGELQTPKIQPAPSLPSPLVHEAIPITSPIRTGIRRPAPPDRELTELLGLGPIDLLRGRSPALGSQEVLSPAFSALLARVTAEPKKFSRAGEGITCSPGLGKPGDSSPAIAFTGPCGSGKTTTIMKLALVYGVLVSRPVRLLALDPQRMGATVRLQNFAGLLSLTFTAFESPGQLSRALEFQFDGLTLIDADHSGLALCLQSHPHIETQLVIRADRKTSDNLRAIENSAKLSCARLILTALDQTHQYSDLLTLIERSALPVSFLCDGERIPEDLESASSARLTSLIGEKSRNARSAA